MFQLKQFYAMDEVDGDGGNGDGGQGPVITPEIRKLMDAEIAGLKSKNSEVILKNKELQENMKRFDGIDPDAVRNILQRFADDEEAKLIASGKLDEVLNKRTERMKQSYDKELATVRKEAEADKQTATKYKRSVLENGIRAEAAAAGIYPHAIDDALLRAGASFLLDDEGSPVAAEGLYGKDGQPLTLKEWFAEMKDKAPHWWPATANGGGAPHSGGKGGQPKGNIGGDKADRLAAIRSQFPELGR